MTKKQSSGEKDRRRKILWVRCSEGSRQRFLRGMITHGLVQRGLAFDDAYAVARAVRDALEEREEVTTSEIRDLVDGQLEALLGAEEAALLKAPVRPASERQSIEVEYHGQTLPFSRGLLARSIHAAGLALDRAYLLVTELEGELRSEKVHGLGSDEIARRVAELLEKRDGKAVARRYRLVRRIHRLPRPVVIYVGGASGTGKSTLSLELAPLLRIYRINATDTIRQVMRMVFSPAILPALHGSSFESVAYGHGLGEVEAESPREPGFEERLLASFEEQSTRVCVGVRAVVERAIAENMSILVEGVHLYPPLVPFTDLEGAAYQVPILLASMNQELHRERFLNRPRLGSRRVERYLDSFSAIRRVHDFLVQQAEAGDIPLIDTSIDGESTVSMLRVVTGMLQKRVPDLKDERGKGGGRSMPTLLLVIDGLADRPVRALGGRTPLKAAHLPNLDRLAMEGSTGLADSVAPGVVPDTAAGSLSLFGQSPLAMKRGPVEALGAGLKLRAGDVALRANFASLDDAGSILDRRAGRIREEAGELAKALDRLSLPGSLAEEVEIRVEAGTEHRLAIVLRGDGLSSAIHGSDPGEGAPAGPPLVPAPVNPEDERAVFTARVLALFEQEARRTLAKHPANAARVEKGLPPANTLLTRGAGRLHQLSPLEEAGEPLRLTCISGDRTVLGLASWLGAKTICRKGMTANLDTDLKDKFAAALEWLRKSDLVVLHLKGADIAAHDQRPDLKVSFLERVDERLGWLLEQEIDDLRIAVASDHATLSESGQHAADPLPVILWGDGIEADAVEAYDEQSVATGALQRFPLQMLLSRLFQLR